MSPLFFTFLCFLLTLLPSTLSLSNPDPALVQPFHPKPSLISNTIPAFPEQSDIAGCPLQLPDELFSGVKAACATRKGSTAAVHLQRSRCCPVLAAWLYSAYSATALGKMGRVWPAFNNNNNSSSSTSGYDPPLLPDDSETCVEDLGKAFSDRGIELMRPNETCDMVYCICGIRLHPLSCPEAFSVNENGKLAGDESVSKLEKNCLSSNLGGCSKCLNTLKLLNKKKTSNNSSKMEDRTTKMHNKDCQLMGLTWLLAKNRTAYMHIVTSVFRAIMVSDNGSDPQSCTLNSNGMPLAVDSSEISDQSSSNILVVKFTFFIVSLSLFYVHLTMC